MRDITSVTSKKKTEIIYENPRSNIKEYYVNNNFNDTVINNLGFVDFKKNERNIRLLSVNPQGFGPDTQEKIMMLIRSQQRLQFDRVFFSSPDRLWNSRRIETMKKRISKIGRNIKINTSDT